ncbi:unnamed protein product [Tilletia controversa]|uniref:Chaps-domain-containing protein n=3 Tax=Tilletia TaxID=13289 RepID=A0A8X7N0E1_9BASI|nr:hypothetical protein CF336_g3660 [Tilletia laevis]KAE8205710.1 hypothetical protein CF328_g337 [Tilletia controversa]KAE8260009.1 hypothetical protein A4X03_0g3937 [Tilletia caries]KAE8201016.1 hypothetical protein CF335_g3831 [Tilletia laevis]KAE8255576.1 hypothetical protein A4X06_0g360 [Tilletia controversa]
METFVSQPEFFETEVGESIISRTETLATFRELGPPDLCHFVKVTTSKSSARDIGSYHYVSGVDASSSAALAAYINSLTYELDQNPGFFSNKSQYKLKSGAYCCFNAFSRVDVRVVVRIPGSVDAYVVDLRGERHECTPEIWQEVYLSALLRSILYADDANYRLAGYRKLDPIASPEAEHRFLQAAENLFFKGWQLGSDPEIQVATVVFNHLTNGILKYFGESFRYEIAVNLFEKLYAREPEVAALVAKAYIGMNEELKAVQIMHHAIAQSRLPTGSTLPLPLGAPGGTGQPLSYALLHVQADFLSTKGKTEWALKLAKQAVNSAPSEFVTWAKLTELYIDLEEWDSALFTLNSCPMFTYNERDLHRMPTPSKSHLPIKGFIADSGLVNEESSRDNEADVALLRLPAPALRGTFAKAYALLTRLVSSIGWDELLKCRSAVFVMEEEYRMQKAGAPAPAQPGEDGDTTIKSTDGDTSIANGSAGPASNGVPVPPSQPDPEQQRREREETRTRYENEMKDNGEELGSPVSSPESSAAGSPPLAGQRFTGAPSSTQTNSTVVGGDGVSAVNDKLTHLGISALGANGSAQSIPTIKISTESDHEREKLELETFMKAEAEAAAAIAKDQQTEAEEAEAKDVVPQMKVEVEAPPLEKPPLVQVEGRHERVDSSSASGPGLSGPATGAPAGVGGSVDAQASGTQGAEQIQAQLHQVATVAEAGGQNLQRQGSAQGNGSSAPAVGLAFANKRLCERWLDNLFMVLYEDLRVYTIWRAEVAHYRSQNLAYRKTGTEWEILGELALRLHHSVEARDAFQRCVETKFSAKALLRLLEIYTDAKDVQRSLWTAIRLTAYHHRWYLEGSFPGAVAHNLFKLIRTEGLAKVSYTLVSMAPPQPILKLMQNYFAYAQTFGVPGFNF